MKYLQIENEIDQSRRQHGVFSGSHEGYAVILEEVEELWEQVKRKQRDFKKMEKECIQIAAMAIKFIEDVCEKENPR